MRGKFTLNDVAKEYFQFLGRNENTSEYSVRSVYKNHIEPLLGGKEVVAIKRQDMRSLQSNMIQKKYMGRKYSNKTVNNVTNILNVILNYAVEYEYIGANPCVNFSSLRIVKLHDKVEFWTDLEFKKAIQFEKEYMWFCYLTISYLTGLRKGEIRGLRWDDIDFEKGLIHIKRHVNDKRIHRDGEDENKEWMIVGRKNGDEHILLMDRNTTNLLNLLLVNNKSSIKDNKNVYIFGGHRPVGQNAPKRHLDKIADLANLHRIKVHGLRHSHVSFLIDKGLNAYEIAERIGDSVEMVLKVYGHMFPNPQKNIVKALDENFDFQFHKNNV